MTPSDILDSLQTARHYVGPGFWFVLALPVVELLNLVSLRSLNALGIRPREAAGLPGILCSPLLHIDIKHFLANFPPAAALSIALGQLMPAQFTVVFTALLMGTGMAVWLLARPVVHVGASGMIYALFGFLTLHGYLSGNVMHVIAATVLLVLYSGFLWGVIPKTAQTSWESHLAGLAVGLALAWWEPVLLAR